MKFIKSIIASFALASASYGFVGVAVTSVGVTSAHAASSFGQSLQKRTERNLKSSQRNIARQINKTVNNAQDLAIVSTIGVASGGILLTNSQRRKLQKMQKDYAKKNPQTQYQPIYQSQVQVSNKYQQYYLK